MSVIERGVKEPKLEAFVSIAEALGVSADAFLLDVVNNATNDPPSTLVYGLLTEAGERDCTYKNNPLPNGAEGKAADAQY